MTLLAFYGGESQDPNSYFYNTGNGLGVVAGMRGPGNSWTGGQGFRQITPSAKVFFGINQKSDGMDGLSRLRLIVYGDNGATEHLVVHANNARCYVTRGGTEIATANYPHSAGLQYYYEVEATIHDTTGTVRVKINGTEVINFTGDTRNGGTSTNIDMVGFQGGGFVCTYDDFYVCNDVGAAPHNTGLGDIRVVAIRPTGAGNSTGFTPDSGANWSRVNETPPSAANYVSAAAPAKDTYAMADLAASPVPIVLGVRTWALAKNSDGGAASVRNVLRSGGTDYVGSSVALGAFDAGFTTLYGLNPATSAQWTPSEVNAIEVGVERV